MIGSKTTILNDIFKNTKIIIGKKFQKSLDTIKDEKFIEHQNGISETEKDHDSYFTTDNHSFNSKTIYKTLSKSLEKIFGNFSENEFPQENTFELSNDINDYQNNRNEQELTEKITVRK